MKKNSSRRKSPKRAAKATKQRTITDRHGPGGQDEPVLRAGPERRGAAGSQRGDHQERL